MDKDLIILWDIGNVFLKPIHDEILRTIYEAGTKKLTSDEYKNKTSNVLNLSFYGIISLEDTWEKLFCISGVYDSIIKNQIKHSYTVERNEELIQKVISMSKKYRIGIVSDLSQIGYYTLSTYFHDLLSVCDSELVFVSVLNNITKVKEGKRWFYDIVKEISEFSNMIVFVDDDLKNINSAHSCGINAIPFEKNRNNTWEDANKNLFRELSKFNVKV